jgi:hypothetical protein
VLLPDIGEQLEAIEIRHDDIGDDYEGSELVDPLQGFAAVCGGVGHVAPTGDEFAQSVTRRFLVIDYEHPLIRHRAEV